MKHGRSSLRLIVIVLWTLGILCPFYSGRPFSASYREAFDWVFHTHASHVLMHTFLYGVLAWLLASFFRVSAWEDRRRELLCVMASILGIAILQEAIQMVSEQVPLGHDEVFDVLVDLNGGLLGGALYVCLARRRLSDVTMTDVTRLAQQGGTEGYNCG